MLIRYLAMALIYNGIKCAICHREIDLKGQYVATTHFIADPKDPLWRFSDAAMHRSCFEQWEHRDEFTAKYEAFKAHLPRDRGSRAGT